MEHVQRNSEELVIYKPTVSGKEAHKQEKIPSKNSNFKSSTPKGISGSAEDDAGNKQQGPMANVSEHHAKQEWERNDGEDCWVGLSVTGNSIGSDQGVPRS